MMYDIIVIGAGPGGYVAAIKAAQLGRKVALVESHDVGGVCLNWGCIPTKALLKSAQVVNHCRHSEEYGVEIEGEVKPNISKIIARSRTVAETMSRGVEFLLNKNGVEKIVGRGEIVAPNTVKVDGTEYTATDIIIATGARPRKIDAIPTDGENIITSREALAMERIPSSIVVVGSGAIGSEFAYLYSSLGSKVTIVEYMPRLMPLEDEEVSKTMERAFRKLRIGVMCSTKVNKVSFDEGTCTVEVEGKKGVESINSEVVLSAVGIKSNIENIGLEALGIAVERDKIVVNNNYETSVKGIYAIGDIIATPALAHTASAEALHCVEHICGLSPKDIDYSKIPSCIFTSPEVASVGITEQQAKEREIEYSVGKFPFTASGKATAASERDGFVKLIFDSDKKLIGAHMVGAGVAEMIATPTLALSLGASAEQIATTTQAHPSLSEAIMEAAEAALGRAIHV